LSQVLAVVFLSSHGIGQGSVPSFAESSATTSAKRSSTVEQQGEAERVSLISGFHGDSTPCAIAKLISSIELTICRSLPACLLAAYGGINLP
jgi:hypothetical protein